MQALQRAAEADTGRTATDVLVVGAGPTGLVLAIVLARAGVRFRIIDEGSGPGNHSRAMVVQARTLEFYRQFGFADAVVQAGIKLERARLREADDGGSHEIASVPFSDLGDGLSAFPFPLCYPQDDHERFLVERLLHLGVHVEWNTRLETFTDSSTAVSATLVHNRGISAENASTETVTVQYVCGCDGAHSTVRAKMGVGFPGGTYEQLFYVADVERKHQEAAELEMCLGAKLFVLVLPVRRTGTQRLIGIVPTEFNGREDLQFSDIRNAVEPLLTSPVTTVNWFATYRVHHRVAEHFSVGRAFLLGMRDTFTVPPAGRA